MGYHHWLALNFLQASDIMDIPEEYQDTIHSQKNARNTITINFT